MKTQLTWYGQSAFKIVTPSGKVLLVDPWLTNPVFEKAKDELAALKHVDLILVTHGHSDHVGDAVEIGKRTRAKLVATFDLADAMVKHLGYPAELAQADTIGHFGGELTLLDGDVKVLFVRAHHGSGVSADDKHRSVFRYGVGVAFSQSRHHARLHRRPFYDGTRSCGGSGQAGWATRGGSHALRNVSTAHGHA